MLKISKLDKVDSDTELIDVTQPEIDDDDLIIVESDVDTDSDFERVNSDTELLLLENCANSTSVGSTRTRFLFTSPKSRLHGCLSSCLSSQCGPRQWYDRVRNSLTDTYGCLVGCVASLRVCGKCRQRRKWTPGEVRGQTVKKLKRLRHSVVNLVRLIFDRRIFVSTFLYGLLAFFTIMCQEVGVWKSVQMCRQTYCRKLLNRKKKERFNFSEKKAS